MGETFAYTGSYPCGCIVNVAIAEDSHPARTVEDVHEWSGYGLDIGYRPLREIKADPAFLRNCGAPEHKDDE